MFLVKKSTAARLSTEKSWHLFVSLWKDFNRADTSKSANELSVRFARSESVFFLAYDDLGSLCGFASCLSTASLLQDRPSLELTSLFVEPTFRRKGLGSALISRILEWGRKECCEGLHVSGAPSAEKFYSKIGFKRYASRLRLSVRGQLVD